MIIGIAGGSGSGKTYFCHSFLKYLGADNTTLLSQDHYYKGHDGSPLTPEKIQALAQANYDHPDSLEFELLASHIQALKNKESIEVPVYDFATHSRLNKTTAANHKPFIVVEGILILSQPNILELLDYSIFVDVPDDKRFQRRLARDQKERGRSVDSVVEQFNKTVNPMHQQFVEPSKRNADIIISGEDKSEENIRKVIQDIGQKSPSLLNNFNFK